MLAESVAEAVAEQRASGGLGTRYKTAGESFEKRSGRFSPDRARILFWTSFDAESAWPAAFQLFPSVKHVSGINQRRSASSNPSVLFCSPVQAMQASGRISIERPINGCTTYDTEEAKAAFLAIVDKGTIGLKAAMAGTPYA